jgi:hypothetical protein
MLAASMGMAELSCVLSVLALGLRFLTLLSACGTRFNWQGAPSTDMWCCYGEPKVTVVCVHGAAPPSVPVCWMLPLALHWSQLR